MQQRLSKLEAAQRLGVSPSTLDRMIRRGELEIEREGRGTGPRCGSWRLGYPAMPPVANPSLLVHRRRPSWRRQGSRSRRSKSWRTIEEAPGRSWRSSGGVRRCWRADQGAAARRVGGVAPGTALVALRTGLDGVLALPPQAGVETRCTTGPTSRRLLHPGPCGLGPGVPGGGLPDRLGGVAQGPGAPARAGDPQVRWLLPVQVPGRHRLPGKLFVHAVP